ncbi:MAG: EAL domain-containing protein [Microbacteriaceae bacterium]|nr:EAL domain-containing protein [Burkholderiaceae bacterium]
MDPLAPVPTAMPSDLAVLLRRAERERSARKAAEKLLTEKSRELWDALQRAKDSERRLNLALWATGEGIWEWDLVASQVKITGLVVAGQPLPIATTTMDRLLAGLHRADQLKVRSEIDRHADNESGHIDLAFRVRHSGEWHWLRIRGRALQRDGNGRALQVTGTIRDVSHLHAAEQLRQLMAHAFASTLDALVVVQDGWTVVQANAAFEALMGLGVGGAAGQHLRDLLRFVPDITQLEPWCGEAYLRAEVTDRAFEVTMTRIEVPDSPPQHLVALRDISERRRAEQALERMARFDSLTNLANRDAINQHLALRVARVDGPAFSLMFIDIDGFKGVNDSFGHRAGDLLLQQVAERLRNALPLAFIGRWGGDEFVVVLPDGGDDYQLREGAQLVIATLGQPFQIDGHRLSVTPSIGAVNHPADGADAALLLRRADAAMYAAKAQGRNCLVIYTPKLDDGVERRSRLQSLVRSDAERNAFHFVVQPKVNAAGRTTGAELLMRWTTEEFGPVSPTEFIPIAEQIGMIPLMGRHAMHAAARIANEVRALGSDASVAVNLSPRQLLRPDLERTVLHACQHNGVEPSQIELELTESALVTDIGHVEKLLVRLRRHGFKLSLDDFGTGYSSLSHLRNLPFHKVKIDRSFVMDLDRSPKSRVMLEGLVRLCGNLGMNTVAEGVETEAQFALLRAMGVDEYQGYLFARPQCQAQWIATLQQELAG